MVACTYVLSLGFHLVDTYQLKRARLTCRARNDTLPFLGVAQVRHFVVGTSELEREYRLQILSFEEDMAFKSIAEVDGMC